MFYCSYDVILLGHPELFITKFLEFEANLVFSAEDFCWPDKLLKVCKQSQSLLFRMLINIHCMIDGMALIAHLRY